MLIKVIRDPEAGCIHLSFVDPDLAHHTALFKRDAADMRYSREFSAEREAIRWWAQTDNTKRMFRDNYKILLADAPLGWDHTNGPLPTYWLVASSERWTGADFKIVPEEYPCR